ncbi:MurR/RpiR family transcriptional regulator [Halanaerobium kushneri]|uniref:DNA-binding transcriptional regulator, MurR/RpiR family, contains HTH and SIS domains n=1 Tax=Halanaerobium kushneri TaxID=56779 RepID=A0A1N6S059_9FIRM|nr:SIS domain-containing protein [Halanaerobium kushneri]SIQ34450.1 DNA-binding transcriptional regulator, MurR/RpiR family, contains HTH and SIS domains [Halanaerobium kushneri]
MINIDLDNLNDFEKEIYAKLLEYSKDHPAFKIRDAAEVCDCSVSKISKYVKKLGFDNYKQYIAFLYDEEIPNKEQSDELKRIRNFIDDFDTSMIDEFIELIDQHEKLVLFGYGPSGAITEYFEYKFRTCTDKMVVSLSDDSSISSMLDDKTLLIIFTATGSFCSFKPIYEDAKEQGAKVAIVVEEYNTSLFNQCDKIFWLSKFNQPDYLEPYQKTRTIFFIFIEEVIRKIILNNMD